MNSEFQAAVRNAQNLMKLGAICAGISLIFGGVLLGTAGLICVFVGRSRFNKAYAKVTPNPSLQDQMKKLFNIALGVCLIALVLNTITMMIMVPLMPEILSSGDMSSIYGSLGSGAGSSVASGSSTWG